MVVDAGGEEASVAGRTHLVAVPGAVTVKVVALQDDVRAEKPWDNSVLETSGISSCVLIMDRAQPSHMALDTGAAVLVGFEGCVSLY